MRMTRWLSHLAEIADRYDAIVLDQWGVLHDGTRPYPGAVMALEQMKAGRARLAVLSNSGKRAAPNLTRIARSCHFVDTGFISYTRNKSNTGIKSITVF
jgi:ribonucleotide monophosphatase NagD (HAD superfamily)